MNGMQVVQVILDNARLLEETGIHLCLVHKLPPLGSHIIEHPLLPPPAPTSAQWSQVQFKVDSEQEADRILQTIFQLRETGIYFNYGCAPGGVIVWELDAAMNFNPFPTKQQLHEVHEADEVCLMRAKEEGYIPPAQLFN